MPVQTLHTVQAQHVQRGDHYLGQPVTDRRVATKYTYLTFGTGSSAKTHRYAHADTLPITRLEATPEEQAAERRAALLDGLDWMERMDRDRLAKAGRNVAQTASAGGFPNWNDLETLATAAPTVAMWDEVANTHRYGVLGFADEAAMWDAPSRLDTLRLVAENALRRQARYVTLGGSTSPASNLETQGKHVAELAWASQVLDALGRL